MDPKVVIAFHVLVQGRPEVGHGGMAHFIHDKAPNPNEVAAWLQYGASLACYAMPVDSAGAEPVPGVNSNTRFLLASTSMLPFVEPAFKDLPTRRLVGDKDANIGEMREIMGAGNPRAFGMAGLASHPVV